jgi:hypothetical protein
LASLDVCKCIVVLNIKLHHVGHKIRDISKKLGIPYWPMSPDCEGWRCLLVTFKNPAVAMATRENKLRVRKIEADY